ncbi:heme ABC exporter ATP-binding protein CcmA [Longimicrobium sp.]|uniref:heme ABC exporter ATP-binding protein CcmA n=1 Tax=Longimicrobium sp. TaxID=2029185 RepID=UPI002D1AE686|nr:heme ABC exporter ATP-binding protein CcmA [Longimicrobium sp.]HSU17433.1 heme ABC exporter ATP-binding protein CcmA [Longimicrobium sp.]
MTAPALEARALEKWYGPLPAVRGIEFTLARGEFLVVFGPNGAGKTTLLRMLCGAVRPTRGSVLVAGGDVGDEAARRRIGLLSHQTFLYPGLTAAENLDFYGRLYGLKGRREVVDAALDSVGLRERRDDRVRTFSRGMQQRLALARTLLHSPEVVLLDEPYTGLDPHAAAMLSAALERLRDGRTTVVLVTHNLSQGLEQADRVAVQVGGRWVSDEPRAAVDAAAFERLYTARVAAAV